MSAESRVYGGVTGEQRRARRRTALLDAALDVIAEAGAAGITVRGVSASAGLTDRYFYENFRDRDELLGAVADELLGQATAVLLGAIADLPHDRVARTRAAIQAGVEWITADSRRGRFFLELQTTPALQSRRRDAIKLLAEIMADQGRDLLGDQAPSDRDSAMAAHTLVAGGFDLFAAWLRGEVDASREQLTHFLIAMILTTADVSAALATLPRNGRNP